jgi:hypothetical protein
LIDPTLKQLFTGYSSYLRNIFNPVYLSWSVRALYNIHHDVLSDILIVYAYGILAEWPIWSKRLSWVSLGQVSPVRLVPVLIIVNTNSPELGLCGSPLHRFVPVPPRLLPLAIASKEIYISGQEFDGNTKQLFVGLVFCGGLVILSLRGILNTRERVSTPKPPQNVRSWTKNLYETLQKEKFHYYCLAFLAQVPSLVRTMLQSLVDCVDQLRITTRLCSSWRWIPSVRNTSLRQRD